MQEDKEVAGLLNAVPGSFEWRMDWMQEHKMDDGCTGCTNAVPVVWLPAGQSLQNTLEDGWSWRTRMVGDMGRSCNKGEQAWVQGKGRQVKAWQMRTRRYSTTGRHMKLAGLWPGP